MKEGSRVEGKQCRHWTANNFALHWATECEVKCTILVSNVISVWLTAISERERRKARMPCASKAVPHSAMFFFLISISRASSAALLSSASAAVAVRFLPLNRAVCCRSALFADRFVTQQHCYHLSFSWHVLKFTGTRQRLMMIKCVCVCVLEVLETWIAVSTNGKKFCRSTGRDQSSKKNLSIERPG